MTLRELLDAATEGHKDSCSIHGVRPRPPARWRKPQVCDCGYAKANRALRDHSLVVAALVLDMADALRRRGHVPPCALWITSGDAGPNGEQHPCTCDFEALLARLDRIGSGSA